MLAASLPLVATGTAEAVSDAIVQTPRESSILTEVNRARTGRGLTPLRVDPALVRAARGHSATLLRSDVLFHGAFRARLLAAGARGPAFGENLALGVGATGAPRAIVTAWLGSPAHRANILRPGFRRIGVGARVGEFGGYSGATVVTAVFAGR